MSGIKKNAIVYRVSREMAVSEGLVKPTPEEVAKHNADAVFTWNRMREEWAVYEAARDALAAITEPLARMVLDLHAINDSDECSGCDYAGWEGEAPEWPCRTVRAISERYEVTLPAYVHEPSAAPSVMPPEGFQPIDWSSLAGSGFVEMNREDPK